MRTFEWHALAEAVAWAGEGHQALHLHRFIGDRKRAPACFVRAVERGESIAHLFDRDVGRPLQKARAMSD